MPRLPLPFVAEIQLCGLGGEFGSFNSDFDTVTRIVGPGVDVDFNLTPKIGVIGEARWLHWNGHDSQTQSDYLAGGKYAFFRFHRFTFNAKFLVGGVWMKYPVNSDRRLYRKLFRLCSRRLG